MNVIVQSTKGFNDYNIFVRAMGVALSDVNNGDEFHVYSVGPATINSYTAEFCNKIETSRRSRGIKVRFHKVPGSWVEENIEMFDYFAFLCLPNDRPSHLFSFAETTDMDTAIFRY